MKNNNKPQKDEYQPRLIAWEVTRRCKLKCRHCRAGARDEIYDNELTTQEAKLLLDNIAAFYRPIIILTGGEPTLREDIYELAGYGSKLGLRMVLASCGANVDEAAIKRMRQAGIQCVSISLDGAEAKTHDDFRGVAGAFETAIAAIAAAKRGGMPVQINTTLTSHNIGELNDIIQLAEKLGAITFNPFMLVPTGRGSGLAEQQITAKQYEETLHWLKNQQGKSKMQIRVTCAPHYQRIIRQEAHDEKAGRLTEGHAAAGCMGGKSFAFISHTGRVQICGFLEAAAGELRENNFDFAAIWRESELLGIIRDTDGYLGKCGRCEYRRVCGGCRARAYAVHGDWRAEEPFCMYEPERPNDKAEMKIRIPDPS